MSEEVNLSPLSKELLQVLDEQSEREEGSFYAHGSTSEFEDLQLQVNELGGVRLPLAPRRAKQLIKHCKQAPYGKGSKTMVDTSVRNVWELGPRKFAIGSAAWKAQLNEILDNVASDLGLAQQKISARLYKLLVYETGGFFLAHQDTEKSPGMFATLVISLPSQHSGGSLVLRHQDEEKRLNFGGKKSSTHLQYLSFFADCQHEVKPIRSGYRCCLVYNLHFPKQRANKNSQPGATLSQEALLDVLRRWHQTHPADGDLDPNDWNYKRRIKTCSKLAFVFDHQYTQAQLALHYLKGQDFSRAQALLQSADAGHYEAHLVLLSFYEMGVPRGGFNEYDYQSRSRRYGYWYDEDEDEDNEYDGIDVDAPMDDVCEESYLAEHWFTPSGKRREMGGIDISEREVVANIAFKNYQADQTEYEGYMGNYGPNLERWYRRAALVLWPKESSASIFLGAGFAAAVGELQSRIQVLNKLTGDKKIPARDACRAFTNDIFQQARFYEGGELDKQALVLLMRLLPNMDDEKLNRLFFSNVLQPCYTGGEGNAVVELLNAIGWWNYHDEFLGIFSQESPQPCIKPLQLLTACLEFVKENSAKAPALKVLKQAAKTVLQHFPQWLDKNSEADPFDGFYSRRYGYRYEHDEDDNEYYNASGNPHKIKVLTEFLEQGHELFTATEKKEFVQQLINASNTYPLHTILMPMLLHFRQQLVAKKTLAPLAKLFVSSLLALLKKHTAQAIQQPKHWKMEAKWGCYCEDCSVLRGFLADPRAQRLEVKMAKARRQHMHHTIDRHIPDLSHETRRKGSPYTLVFEKNRNSYKEKERLWQIELNTVKQWPR